MRINRTLVPFLVVVALTGMLPARAAAQIEQGDKRFSFDGTISKSTAAGADVEGNVSGELGWYVRRNIALKGGVGIFFSGSNTLELIAVGSEFNMAEAGDTKIPFVSLDVGTLFGSGLSAFVVQPGVGAHFFLSRQTSFDAQLLYRYTTVSVAGASGNDGTIELNFGLSFFFGGGAKR